MALQLVNHPQTQKQAHKQKSARHSFLLAKPIENCMQKNPTFKNIPEEVWLRIFSAIAESNFQTEETDPLRLGWRDEAETLRGTRKRLAELGPLRLVSRCFLHLSTPLYFQRVFAGKRYQRLVNLLSTSPPPRLPNGIAGDQYGKHVREILIGLREPHAITDLLYSIHKLVPRVIQLSSLRLNQLPSLLSPAIVFPELQSFSELSGVPVSSPRTPLCRHLMNPWCMENFLSLLNHHPLLRKLSCRGFRLNTSRFINVLRSSLLAVPLLGYLRPTGVEFTGLQTLHFGLDCILDIELLQLLPTATPALEQLHIDAGCRIEDNKALTYGSDRWSLVSLVAALPQLFEFSFIGRQSLPNPENDFWECEEILNACPNFKHLNLRMDSIGPGILRHMQQLKQLNLWHSPPVYGYEGWGIVSIDQPAEAGKLGSALVAAGLLWPREEDGRKDIWIKLKSLIPAYEMNPTSSNASLGSQFP